MNCIVYAVIETHIAKRQSRVNAASVASAIARHVHATHY